MYSELSVLGDFPSARLENSEINVSWAPMTNAQAEDICALAKSTDLSLLIMKDKHWSAAAVQYHLFPHEAQEAMEVKVRGAYTAKITPLHYACKNNYRGGGTKFK